MTAKAKTILLRLMSKSGAIEASTDSAMYGESYLYERHSRK